MEKKIKINATFDTALLKRVDAYASLKYTDRSSAIQQLVSFALRELNKKEAVLAYREGRMTIRQCADMLGVDYFEMDRILNSENVPIITDSNLNTKSIFTNLKDSFNDNK